MAPVEFLSVKLGLMYLKCSMYMIILGKYAHHLCIFYVGSVLAKNMKVEVTLILNIVIVP